MEGQDLYLGIGDVLARLSLDFLLVFGIFLLGNPLYRDLLILSNTLVKIIQLVVDCNLASRVLGLTFLRFSRVA